MLRLYIPNIFTSFSCAAGRGAFFVPSPAPAEPVIASFLFNGVFAEARFSDDKVFFVVEGRDVMYMEIANGRITNRIHLHRYFQNSPLYAKFSDELVEMYAAFVKTAAFFVNYIIQNSRSDPSFYEELVSEKMDIISDKYGVLCAATYNENVVLENRGR